MNEMNTLFPGMNVTWNLVFGIPPEEPQTVTPADMEEMCFFTENDGTNIFQWRGCKLAGRNFKVECVWKRINERLTGRLSFSGNESGLYVETVKFPIVTFPATNKHTILTPFNQGETYPVFDEKLINYPQGKFRSFLFCACYDETTGIYFDHRDALHYNKEFKFTADREKSLLTYEPSHFVPLCEDNKSNWKLDFDSTICQYKGNWFEACLIYREWAHQQSWYRKRNKNNHLRELAVWIWNRGLSENVVPPVEQLQKDLGLPVALDWYWWHKIPYDMDYPEFWPPREGKDKFRKVLDRLKKEKIFAQVYVNSLSWDTKTWSWDEGGSESVIVKRDGSNLALAYNSHSDRWLGTMCGKGLPFRKRICELVKTLHNSGLPGVYLDMIGCGWGYNCYSSTHDHAPGGGNYQVEGYRELLETIHANNPGISLCTESCVEYAMDLFDSSIILAPSYERMGGNFEVVPAFSAVYHGAMALFGNFNHFDGTVPFDNNWPQEWRWKKEKAWHKLYPLQFYADFARTIIWGQQPTICNLKKKHSQKAEYHELYEYMLSSARFYYENRNFLYDGVMLAPGKLSCNKVKVEFMIRSIFTAEDKMKTRIHELPVILHSCWQDPASGNKKLILANYTGKDQKYNWNNDVKGTLPARQWSAVMI